MKVKYQGHVSQNMRVSGALVFHKHILFRLSLQSHDLQIKLVNIRKLSNKHQMYYLWEPVVLSSVKYGAWCQYAVFAESLFCVKNQIISKATIQ